MKIILLISEGGRANNYLANKISEIDSVKIKVIMVRKKKNFLSNIKKFIINILAFIYMPNFKFKYLILNFFKTKSVFVDDINSLDVIHEIDRFSPDLLVVSGTKKIDQKILKKVNLKINLHHGLVPSYGGVSSPNWVSFERDFGNFGVTIHEPTDKLDRGPLLVCKRILPYKGEPLILFKYRIFWEGYFILINCIKQIVKKNFFWVSQDSIDSRNLKHLDKPINFSKPNKEIIYNFEKFSSINGLRNNFFFPRYKFKELEYKRRSNCGWYVLNYHDICSYEQALNYKKNKFPRIYTTLKNFKTHIQYMRQEGEILSVKDALKCWENGEAKDKILFSITFDDGLFSSIEAIEFLKTLNISPTLFLNGKPFLNTKNILNNHPHIKDGLKSENIHKSYFIPSDLIKLIKKENYSFELGSHTFSHKNLSQSSDEEAKYEINHCHNYLEECFVCKIPYFAFPFGKLNFRNYNADKASRSLGVKIFECYGGVNKRFMKHFNILRIGVHNETKDEFKKLLSKQWIR